MTSRIILDISSSGSSRQLLHKRASLPRACFHSSIRATILLYRIYPEIILVCKIRLVWYSRLPYIPYSGWFQTKNFHSAFITDACMGIIIHPRQSLLSLHAITLALYGMYGTSLGCMITTGERARDAWKINRVKNIFMLKMLITFLNKHFKC